MQEADLPPVIRCRRGLPVNVGSLGETRDETTDKVSDSGQGGPALLSRHAIVSLKDVSFTLGAEMRAFHLHISP